jgi:hypothetical protein
VSRSALNVIKFDATTSEISSGSWLLRTWSIAYKTNPATAKISPNEGEKTAGDFLPSSADLLNHQFFGINLYL